MNSIYPNDLKMYILKSLILAQGGRGLDNKETRNLQRCGIE